jgi:hypothetical protein
MLPAQKTRGLYTTGFVEADPSHAFRVGSGRFIVKLSLCFFLLLLFPAERGLRIGLACPHGDVAVMDAIAEINYQADH